MIHTTTILLAALLSILPPCERAQSVCLIERSRDGIVERATIASEETGVPVGVLMSVGYFESWLGTHPGEGGGWGAPIDFRHRHTAGTATHAARVLANGFRHCHTWRGAVGFFRSGACAAPRNQGYVNSVMRNIARIYANAGVSMPEHLE